MSSEWKEYSIDQLKKDDNGSIAIGPFGSRMKSDCYVESGIPVIRGTNITGSRDFDGEFVYITKEKADQLGSSNVYKGDLVFPHRGSIGEVGIVLDDRRYVISSSLMKLTCNESIVNPLYLFYFFKTKQGKHELLKNASQVGTPGIGQPLSSLKSIRLQLPKLSTQNKIVDILDVIDKKLAKNNQINQTLESISQTLFKSWFVDFDPVKAKIAANEQGEDPQLAAMMAISGKSGDEINQMPADKRKQLVETADLFPDEMVESELGEIPKGWKWTAFGELLDKTVGGDWGQEQPDEKHTEEVRIIRGTDIPTLKNGGLDKIPTRYVEKKKLASRKLDIGDIVIEISGGSKDQPTGRSIYITQNILNRLDGVAEPASFCRLLRPIDEKVGLLLGAHLQYIYDAGKTWLYQNQSTGISNFQTTIFLENELIPYASDDIINAFYNIVNPLLNKITSNENITLSTIRDSLLPKLLSGSLQID